MNDEPLTRRRYDDDEVAEILARATEDHEVRPAEATRARHGLTLGQLQEIGSEVGIEPARIEEAARSLERRAAAPAPRTFLGAVGKVTTHGSLRTWNNGNLQAHVELRAGVASELGLEARLADGSDRQPPPRAAGSA